MNMDYMLLLRYSSYKKYDFIQEHQNIIKRYGSVWMMKVGKNIPENKLQTMYKNGGDLILRSPKSEGCKFYKASIKSFYSGKSKSDMKYPEYYKEMLDDEDLWFLESLTGTWFEVERIEEMAIEEAETLVLISNGKRAIDVLANTRSSMIYVKK